MVSVASAKKAYRAATQALANAIATGAGELYLSDEEFRDLRTIPIGMQDAVGLTELYFDSTQIEDLSPLAGMRQLKGLRISNTRVRDLSPLQGLTEMQILSLDGTRVKDLSPLRGMLNLLVLSFDETDVTDLYPLSEMLVLESLSAIRTEVIDLSPLKSMTALLDLFLSFTKITDLSPLHGLPSLQELYIAHTGVTDLSPLKDMPNLYELALDGTSISDLRLLTTLPNLDNSDFARLWFEDTRATQQDKTLYRLSAIKDTEQRTRDTLAYLKTLPPWTEPLPWDAAAPPPNPDPALPLRSREEGISLATVPITDVELDDPIRATLHAALQDQVTDLIRVSGNIDEATYTQACKLRDLLEIGPTTMSPLLVHLAIEALRRIRTGKPATVDRDYLLALTAVIDTGPGLTLDTQQVQLFIDRAKRNRLERLAEVETDVQIRLAQSIADSDLSAPDLKKVAALAADDTVQDQFTAIRPTLVRNYTIAVGQFVLAGVLAGPLGDLGGLAFGWLVANAAEITSMSVVWGEPFAAWIAPIINSAQQIAEGAKHAVSKLRNRK